MEYITHRRLRDTVLCGVVNLPACTVCETLGGVICHDGKPLVGVKSENAYQFFARNDDGQGLRRGHLTQEIQAKLRKHDSQHQARWDRVWKDPLCQKYKRPEHEDFWIWNHDFFNAPIADLQHIAALVGAKE